MTLVNTSNTNKIHKLNINNIDINTSLYYYY